MPTRNAVLTEHQEKFIETLANSGRYRNASEVLREGLRLLEEREAEEATKLKTLQEAAQSGFSALNRGEFNSMDELQAYLRGARPAGKLSDAFNFLKRSDGPALSVEEIGEIAARGWAGER
jgi:antitoxin ParD1/3/4